MNAKQKLHQAKLAEWAARFVDQKASGLTVRQWCEQNNVSFHAYHYWKHQLKEEAADQLLPDIVPLSFPADLHTELSGNPLPHTPVRANRAIRADHTNASTSVNVTINGILLEMNSSIPEDFLISIIRTVRYA